MATSQVMPGSLRHVVAAHWWILLVRGLVAMLFGVLAFVWPGLTLASLVLLYGAYCLVDGVVALTGGFGGGFWRSLLLGAVSIGAGIATFLYPGLTALILLYLIAAWAIIRGIIEIGVAIEFRKVLEGEWMLIAAGALSIAFGVLLYLYPGAGALSVVWIIGIYAFVFGALLVALSFRVKSFA
jgi:uncharacterized membrane protein HdeD (DUF308 family)